MVYKLELPLQATIHQVFCISQLKKVVEETHLVQPEDPILLDKFEWVLEPQDVLVCWLNGRTYQCMNRYGSCRMTSTRFPELHLEDMVFKTPQGDVRPLVVQMFARRGYKGNTSNMSYCSYFYPFRTVSLVLAFLCFSCSLLGVYQIFRC